MSQDEFDFDDDNGDEHDHVDRYGHFSPNARFGAVLAYFKDNVAEGLTCPCCGQYAKIYRRKLNKTMLKALRVLCRAGGITEYVHAQSFLQSNVFGGDVGKTNYWGLVEELQIRREDGGRAGYWKVTPKGVDFLKGKVKVRKYALIYNGRFIMYDGEEIDIDGIAPEFRLDDLMNGQ